MVRRGDMEHSKHSKNLTPPRRASRADPPPPGEGDSRHRRASQALMAVVAERRRLGSLAGAKLHRAVARRLPFQRLEAGDLMRAVAERLALGAAATAPPVALARDHLDQDRLASADLRFLSHSFPLRLRARDGSPRTRAPFPAPVRL